MWERGGKREKREGGDGGREREERGKREVGGRNETND
jgi:hypothetical protein